MQNAERVYGEDQEEEEEEGESKPAEQGWKTELEMASKTEIFKVFSVNTQTCRSTV